MNYQNRRPIFSGQPDEWRYLVESWGLEACRLMRAGDGYRAFYAAQLAFRFARRSALFSCTDKNNLMSRD